MDIVFKQNHSQTADKLADIMHGLQQITEVDLALLATDDGIPLQRLAEQHNKAGAVAGFILAAARQGFAMLDLRTTQEIVIRNDQQQLFVSRIFPVNESWLVLTILFKREVPYKRLLNKTIHAIVTTVEN